MKTIRILSATAAILGIACIAMGAMSGTVHNYIMGAAALCLSRVMWKESTLQ